MKLRSWNNEKGNLSYVIDCLSPKLKPIQVAIFKFMIYSDINSKDKKV